jgi:uncharacterized membrane protein
MKKNLLTGVAMLAVSAIVPFAALAQGALPPTPGGVVAPTVIASLGGVSGLLCTVVNWMFYFLIILAIIFVMIAAYGYLTAAGDPDKVKAASNRLIYAAVAVAVGILAKGVPFIVATLLITGGGNIGGC